MRICKILQRNNVAHPKNPEEEGLTLLYNDLSFGLLLTTSISDAENILLLLIIMFKVLSGDGN